jgi:hypothetical protein
LGELHPANAAANPRIANIFFIGVILHLHSPENGRKVVDLGRGILED